MTIRSEVGGVIQAMTPNQQERLAQGGWLGSALRGECHVWQKRLQKEEEGEDHVQEKDRVKLSVENSWKQRRSRQRGGRGRGVMREFQGDTAQPPGPAGR